MKFVSTATLIAALSFSAATFAQSGDMGNMKMGDKGMQNCMEMKGMKDMDMKGMDMKDMDAKKCKDMMDFDAAQGKVTLAHGPVKSLGWPAMTMGFAVKDKMLFDKLAVGAKVHVGFKKEGDGYVVTSVK